MSKRGIIFLKKIYECKEGIGFVGKADGASVTYEGDIPGNLPNGMFITLYLDDNSDEIISYDIPFSTRNKTLLAKNGIKLDVFKEKIKVHKDTGLLWRDLKNLSNPYDVYPFEKADLIFKRCGNKALSMIRKNALVNATRDALRDNREWKVSLSHYIDAFRGVEKTGSFEPLDLRFVLKYTEHYRMDGTMFIDKEIEEAYSFINKDVDERKTKNHAILDAKSIDAYVEGVKNELTGKQIATLYELANSNVSVITGEPGTGKTHVIKHLVKCFSKYFGSDSVCLCAPTGKAARRMTELTGKMAKTIHSTLRKMPDDSYICYTKKNPLPYQLVIIDESSMIDVLLMKSVLEAISHTSKVIFVGDYNQLFPVGVGEPFHDLLTNKNASIIKLDKNFRQDNDSGKQIVDEALKVLWNDDKNYKIASNEGISTIHIKEEDILSHISEKTQILSPYNEINNRINDSITGKYDKGERFFIGEKVIFSENMMNYSNGDTGEVISVGKKKIDVNLYGKKIEVPKREWKNVYPAYAITVHKSQGSEYEDTIIFLPEKRDDFITGRLLYTALTRARRKVKVVYYE